MIDIITFAHPTLNPLSLGDLSSCWCPYVVDVADWCLRSDAVTNARLQAVPALRGVAEPGGGCPIAGEEESSASSRATARWMNKDGWSSKVALRSTSGDHPT